MKKSNILCMSFMLFCTPCSSSAMKPGSLLSLELIITPIICNTEVSNSDGIYYTPTINEYEILPVLHNNGEPVVVATSGGAYSVGITNVNYDITIRGVDGRPVKVSKCLYGLVTLNSGDMAALPPLRIKVAELHDMAEFNYYVNDILGNQIGCWSGVISKRIDDPTKKSNEPTGQP